jgi:hypothetical protein
VLLFSIDYSFACTCYLGAYDDAVCIYIYIYESRFQEVLACELGVPRGDADAPISAATAIDTGVGSAAHIDINSSSSSSGGGGSDCSSWFVTQRAVQDIVSHAG